MTFPDAGLVAAGRVIAVTQPRRIAALSLAQRVAEERDCFLGGQVGYSIRFEDVTSESTVIKYMTDGMLCMGALRDQHFGQYGIIILDEAHERTIHSDVLLAMVRRALRRRPELRVVVTSATMDCPRMAAYMSGEVVEIAGSLHPVEVIYYRRHGQKGLLAGSRELLYLQDVIKKITEIHKLNTDSEDGILVFLPGMEELCVVAKSRELLSLANLQTVLVHAALPVELQVAAFTTLPGIRKLVLATNVAETSLTVPGIKYVIDSGYFKESNFDPGRHMEEVVVTPVYSTQAVQRAGRAGRTKPGVCYRMYSEKDFLALRSEPVPAICRSDIVTVCLLLKAMGVQNINNFGFLDPPKSSRVDAAMTTLKRLGAVDKTETVTALGRTLAALPLSPVLGKMVVVSVEAGCSDQVLSLVAMLSVKPVFPRMDRNNCHRLQAAKDKLSDPSGDHLTLLNVFESWCAAGCCAAWAAAHLLDQRELLRAQDVRQQLEDLLLAWELPLLRLPGSCREAVLRAVCSGLRAVDRAAKRHWTGLNYLRTADQAQLVIHSSSVLFRAEAEVVIYQEVIATKKNFMRTVSAIQTEWMQE